MKLAKLSLAAVVAAGALTTVSAASLEEAIKGVDISGAIRYRVDINEKKVTSNNTSTKTSDDKHKFQGYATLSVPVAENLTSVVRAKYNADDTTDEGHKQAAGDRNLVISDAYFQYAANNMIFKAGKMAIGSPWTDNNDFDGQGGNGLFAAYTGVEGWTFAAAHFFNTNIGNGDNTNLGKWLGAAGVTDVNAHINSRDLTAIAAIGSMGPVNARLWLSKMQSVFKHAAFLEVSAKFAGFNVKGQVNSLKLENNLRDSINNGSDTVSGRGTFWGLEAGYDLENFGVKAGYTQNSKKQPVYALEDDNEFIGEGKLINKFYTNMFGAKTWFLTADAKFGKYSVEAGYVHSKASGNDNVKTLIGNSHKAKEYFVGFGYAYSKNFDIDAYYANMETKTSRTSEDTKEKDQRVRIEATYKF